MNEEEILPQLTQEQTHQVEEEEYLQHQESSRVSTNDSNDMELQDDIEVSGAVSFNIDEADIEEGGGGLRIPSSKIKSPSLYYQSGKKILLMISHCFRESMICLIMTVYYLLTSLIFMTMCIFSSLMFLFYVYRMLDLNLTIWIYVPVTMTLMILKVCIQHYFPHSSDLREVLRGSVRHISTRNQSHETHRNRQHINQRARGVSPAQRRNEDIQMAEIRNTNASRNRHSPVVRLRFNTELTLDQMRRTREERIRNDVLNQLLRRVSFARNHGFQRGRASEDINNLLMLRANLQIIQAMNRDFQENDYDALSQLDQYNTRSTTERVARIVNQLPTYLFHLKPVISPSKGQDEIGHIGEIPESSGRLDSDEKLNTTEQSPEKLEDLESVKPTSCSICIEQYVDEDMIKILPCFHQFHAKCADDWLLRKSVCPVCKFDIEVSDDHLINESIDQ